jgi:hypothetical protein
MQGTDLSFEPTTHTFYVHESVGGRKSRVYRQRPSRQRRLFAALRAQTGRRS